MTEENKATLRQIQSLQKEEKDRVDNYITDNLPNPLSYPYQRYMMLIPIEIENFAKRLIEEEGVPETDTATLHILTFIKSGNPYNLKWVLE